MIRKWKISALDAEKNGDTEKARRDWIGLASFEARLGRVENAVKHAKRGISLYTCEDLDRTNFADCLLDRYLLVPNLVSKGEAAAAEELLIEAVLKVEAQSSVNSVPSIIEKTYLLVFYLNQYDQVKAIETLERILEADLKKFDKTPENNRRIKGTDCSRGYRYLARGDVLSLIRKTCVDVSDYQSGEMSFAVLNRILVAQESAFYSDDQRIALTLKALGDCYMKVGNYNEALRYLEKSFNIFSMYWGEARALCKVGENYLKVLSRNDKKDEVLRLTDLRIPSYHKEDERLRNPNLKDEDDCDDSDQYKSRMEAKIAFWVEGLAQFRQEAKYGYLTEKTLRCLQPYSKRIKNWDVLYSVTEEYIKLLDHLDRLDYDTKIDKIEILVDCSLSLNKIDHADKWLDEALKSKSEELDSANDLKLASMCIKCKRHGLAYELLDKVEESVTDDSEGLNRIRNISKLWEMFGNEARALVAQERSKVIYKKVWGPRHEAWTREIRRKQAEQEDKAFDLIQTKIKNLKMAIYSKDWDAVMKFPNSIAFERTQISAEQREKLIFQLLDVAEPVFRDGDPVIAQRICIPSCLQPSRSKSPLKLASRMVDIAEILVSRNFSGYPNSKVTESFISASKRISREEKEDIERKEKLDKRIKQLDRQARPWRYK